jgi:hypothetical protein
MLAHKIGGLPIKDWMRRSVAVFAPRARLRWVKWGFESPSAVRRTLTRTSHPRYSRGVRRPLERATERGRETGPVFISEPLPIKSSACEKASISIDGVSLTVATVGEGWFELALIPETLTRTTLGARPVGSRINLEIDPLARYAFAAIEAQRNA